jgi:hypothetical protein
MKTLALVLLLIVAGPALRAQDFSTVQLKGMPTVYVEDRNGREVEGKLVSLTESALTINIDGVTRTFTPAEVTKVDRRGDSLKNGALIGAAVGLFTGLIGDCPRAGSNNRSDGCPGARVGYVFGGAAIWAGIGAGIDALIPGRTRLWPAPTK